MKKNLIIISSLFAFMLGCATQRIDQGFPLSGENAFEVHPVFNETGKTFDYDVAAELTTRIRSALIQKGFKVADQLEKGTVIRSSLIVYETGSTRGDCSVRSKLIDKLTDRVLAEIVTTRTLHGMITSTGQEIDQAILNVVADDIAFEVESKVRH